MTFLVTGASGFVGGSLIQELVKQYGVDSVQGIVPPEPKHQKESKRLVVLKELGVGLITHDLLKDSLDLAQVKPFDVLFHLAACGETESRHADMSINDVGTERLLASLSPVLKGKRVILSGTLASVDRSFPDDTPQDEEYPCHPRSEYGRTKLRAEEILRVKSRELDYSWTILRLPTIYGPGFRPGGMFDAIAKGLEKNSLSVRLNWPGRLSLLYLGDLVYFLVESAKSEATKNARFQLSSRDNPKLTDIIDLIAKSIGVKRNVISLPDSVWSAIKHAAWIPGLTQIPPFELGATLWRMSLVVIDGLVANGQRIEKLIPIKFYPLELGFREMYKEW